MDWTLEDTWSTACLSAPHSQVAEEAIPHLCRQERKRPTPVRKRLSRTQSVLGRVIPGGGGVGAGDENAESCGVIRPLRCTYVVVFRKTDELLCGGYKWVSRFEAPCICTRWTGKR